jgi:hypothetical protein
MGKVFDQRVEHTPWLKVPPSVGLHSFSAIESITYRCDIKSDLRHIEALACYRGCMRFPPGIFHYEGLA